MLNLSGPCAAVQKMAPSVTDSVNSTTQVSRVCRPKANTKTQPIKLKQPRTIQHPAKKSGFITCIKPNEIPAMTQAIADTIPILAQLSFVCCMFQALFCFRRRSRVHKLSTAMAGKPITNGTALSIRSSWNARSSALLTLL
jgi:hypothetical protein